MSSLIPPINSKGFFTLKSPWAMPANAVYECIAVREFADFSAIGEDLYALVYQPKSLDRTVFETDQTNDEKIITLASATKATIYVPSSYITGYPSMDNVAYSHVVASASLGALPDTLDLTFLQDQLAGVISDVIGVTTEIHLNVAPSDNYISAAQHATLEAARQDAIANRTTDRARLLEADVTIDGLRQKIAQYETFMRQQGWIPQ
jgi:hypothetical protein